MAVNFTARRISAHAGTATFCGWLHSSGFVSVLEKAPRSGNNLTFVEKALGVSLGTLRGPVS